MRRVDRMAAAPHLEAVKEALKTSRRAAAGDAAQCHSPGRADERRKGKHRPRACCCEGPLRQQVKAQAQAMTGGGDGEQGRSGQRRWQRLAACHSPGAGRHGPQQRHRCADAAVHGLALKAPGQHGREQRFQRRHQRVPVAAGVLKTPGQRQRADATGPTTAPKPAIAISCGRSARCRRAGWRVSKPTQPPRRRAALRC